MTDTVDTSKEAVERLGHEIAGFGCLGERAQTTLRALLAERDQLRREVQEARDKALEEAQRAVSLADPQKDLDPRATTMSGNPYLKAWKAIEALKARP